MPAGEYYALRSPNDETVRLLDVLRADRWIELDSGGITAAHDIFADALVARYVFEAGGSINDRAGDVLSDASDAGAFDRALIALNRLAAHERFGDIDGVSIVGRVRARNPGAVTAARELVLKTRLPDDRACIRMLSAFPDLAKAVAEDMFCDGPLSYLAELTAATKDEGWREQASVILQPFLDRAVDRPHNSNMVLRRALRLLPWRYRDRALAWIAGEPTRSETHFLLVAWLQSGLPQEQIAADLEVWLTGGGMTDPKASFVFDAWLDAAARLDPAAIATKSAAVEPLVLAWLEKYKLSPEAQFVLKAWLDAVARLDPAATATKIAAVEPLVLAWVEKYGLSEAARFVYQPWLDAAARLDPATTATKMAPVSRACLLGSKSTTSPRRRSSSISRGSMLRRGSTRPRSRRRSPRSSRACLPGSKSTASPRRRSSFISRGSMLRRGSTRPRPQRRSPRSIGACLRGSKSTSSLPRRGSSIGRGSNAVARLDPATTATEIAAVEPRVLAWLEKHGLSEAAQFVFRAWLDAGGSADRIRERIAAC